MPTDPDIQCRLHKEVTEVFGSDLDNLVSLEQLDSVEQLPVLEAVLAETLRYACVAAGIGRTRKQPFAPSLLVLNLLSYSE